MKRLFTKFLHMLFRALLRFINVCLTSCRREIKRLDSHLTDYEDESCHTKKDRGD